MVSVDLALRDHHAVPLVGSLFGKMQTEGLGCLRLAVVLALTSTLASLIISLHDPGLNKSVKPLQQSA